jgi:hypothetical protein
MKERLQITTIILNRERQIISCKVRNETMVSTLLTVIPHSFGIPSQDKHRGKK